MQVSNFRRKSSEPRVLVVGFLPWPEVERIPNHHYVFNIHYKALAATFRTAWAMVEAPEEIEFNDERPVICVEEDRDNNTQNILEFAHPFDAVYIVGNAKYEFPSDHIRHDYAVHIPTKDRREPMYGHQAAAIVLFHRQMQGV